MSEFRRLTLAEMRMVPGMPESIPQSMFVMGMVDEQGVAAACGVFLVLHADPIWIRPDKRNGGKLLLHLWEATRAEIEARNLGPEVFVGMTEDNPGQPTESVVERMCLAGGGEELKARFFVIPVESTDGLG
jgi:hypothetical protein